MSHHGIVEIDDMFPFEETDMPKIQLHSIYDAA